jgi:hypothetical protein
MVDNGADRALPIVVRRSSDNPNTDNSRIDDRHHDGSPRSEGGNRQSLVEEKEE